MSNWWPLYTFCTTQGYLSNTNRSPGGTEERILTLTTHHIRHLSDQQIKLNQLIYIISCKKALNRYICNALQCWRRRRSWQCGMTKAGIEICAGAGCEKKHSRVGQTRLRPSITFNNQEKVGDLVKI